MPDTLTFEEARGSEPQTLTFEDATSARSEPAISIPDEREEKPAGPPPPVDFNLKPGSPESGRMLYETARAAGYPSGMESGTTFIPAFAQVPGEIGRGVGKVFEPFEELLSNWAQSSQFSDPSGWKKDKNGNIMIPVTKPSDTALPPLPDNIQGFWPSVYRSAQGMTTRGGLIMIPAAPESKALQAVFGAGAAAGAIEGVEEMATAKTPEELKSALGKTAVQSLFFGMIGKGLTSEKPAVKAPAETPLQQTAARIEPVAPMTAAVLKETPAAPAEKPTVPEVKTETPTDEQLIAESTESIVSRTQVGPERDVAFSNRASALKRLSVSLKKGDRVTRDGETFTVDQVFKDGTIFMESGGQWDGLLPGDEISRASETTKEKGAPDAIHGEAETPVRNVQQPSGPEEGAQQVPADVGGQKAGARGGAVPAEAPKEAQEPEAPKKPDVGELLRKRQELIQEIDEAQPEITQEEAERQGHPELKGQRPYSRDPRIERARDELDEINGKLFDLTGISVENLQAASDAGPIESAAYKEPDTGMLFYGANHPEALRKAGGQALVDKYATRESRNTPEFGYKTKNLPFVPRDQAGDIAKFHNQQLEPFDVDETGKEQPHSDEIAATPGGTTPLGETGIPPKPDSAEYNKLPNRMAQGAAGEYWLNQQIIDAGPKPAEGPHKGRVTKKDIEDLKDRQKQVIENFRMHMESGTEPQEFWQGMTLAAVKNRLPIAFDESTARIEDGKVVVKEKGAPYKGRWMVVDVKKGEAEPYEPTGGLTFEEATETVPPASAPETITGPEERTGSAMPAEEARLDETSSQPTSRSAAAIKRDLAKARMDDRDLADRIKRLSKVAPDEAQKLQRQRNEYQDRISHLQSELAAKEKELREKRLKSGKSTKETRFEQQRAPDLIDTIEQEMGGKISLPAARELDPHFTPVGAARKLFADKGYTPDQAQSIAEGKGKTFKSTSDFLEQLNDAARTRKSEREKFYAEEKLLNKQAAKEEEQSDAFKRDIKQPGDDKETIVPENLNVGDEFEINGTKVRAKEFEFDDSGNVTSVTLEDGDKYGVRQVEAGDVLNFDKGTLKQSEVGFLEGEDKAAAEEPVETKPEQQTPPKELSDEAQKIFDQSKAQPDEFHGVDATHLSAEDRRALANRGISFSEDRNNRIIATYPAKLRTEDLRNRVSPPKPEAPPQPQFKEGDKVIVGQYPMQREGVISGTGPLRDGVQEYFVKTNLGEVSYKPSDIKLREEAKPEPKPEPPKPRVKERPLTKKEQDEFSELTLKIRANRESGGPPLTTEETQRYEHLTALAGQLDMLAATEGKGGTATERRIQELRDKADQMDKLRVATQDRAYESKHRREELFKEARVYQEEAEKLRAQASELEKAQPGYWEAVEERERQREQARAAGAGTELFPQEGGVGTGALGELGMGGAKPSEFVPTGSATGIKNAEVDRQRARRGLPPTMVPLRQANPEVWDRAMAHIDQDPGWQDRLIDELKSKPRTPSAEETVALQHRYVDLQNEYDRSTRDLSRAYDDGRMDDVEELKLQTANWSDKLQEFEDMTRRIGTEWGRAGQMRQRLLNRDFSLANMEMQWRAARGGRPLTPDERVELAETQAKLKEAEAKAAAAEEKARQESADKAALAAINEQLKAKLPSFDKRVLDYAEGIVKKMESAADAASQRIKARLKTPGAMSGPIDPTLIDDLAIVGSAKIARFGLEKARFIDEMIRDFGEAIRPAIDQIWDASEELLKKNLSKAPEAVKTVLKARRTTAEKVEDTKAKLKASIKKGEMDAVTPLVQKLVRFMFESDPSLGADLKSKPEATRDKVVDTIHDILKEEMPDITPREVKDAISGYGNFTPLKKDAVSLSVRDLKGQLQQVAKLEDIQSKIPLQKTGLERREPSDAERRLIKNVNEMKRRYGVVITNPATQLKSALNARKTAIKNQIADLEYEIGKKQKIVKTKSPSPTDAELQALKTRRDELKAEHARIFPEAPMSDVERARLAERSIDREIAEVERQIREGDIFPGGPKVKISTPEIEAKRARLEALQAERQWLRESIQPKEYRTPEEKYNSALKARLKREIADKTERMAKGDFSAKVKTEPPPLDKEATRLKAEAEGVRKNWEKKLLEERLKQRTKFEKFLDATVKWRQAFVISGIRSIAKLLSAAVEGIGILPTREAGGGLIGKLPIIRDVAAKAPSEGGFNAKAEAKAITETWKNLLSDFGKNIKGDKPDFEKLYGGRETMPQELQNYVGFLHGALKSPLARNVFERSFAKRIAHAIRNGVDVTDLLVTMEIGRKAWEDSSFWRFQNRNLASSIFRQALARIERTGGAGKLAATVARLELPVVTVPSNIVARVFESVAGVPMGIGRLMKDALKDGGFRAAISNMTPERADLIMRNLKTGSIGTAFMLIGALNPGAFGGYYKEGKKQKKGEPKFGSARLPFGAKIPMLHIPVHGQKLVTMERDIPSFLLHNPFLEAAQFGATMRKIADSKLRKSDKETQGLWLGAWGAATGALEEQPFIREAEDLAKAGNPAQAQRFLGEQLRSQGIPMAIQNFAEYMDKHDQAGEPIKRKPRTVKQHIYMGIPGLRETVPVDKSKR